MSQQFVHCVPFDVTRQPAVAVLVNFGLVAGRKPTRRELTELGAELRSVVPVVTIIDEQRLEVGEQLDVLLEEVRIEVPEGALAMAGADVETVQARMIAIAEAWLSRSATDPGASDTLALRIARQTVVDEDAPGAH